jgi:hypothetical protein
MKYLWCEEINDRCKMAIARMAMQRFPAELLT